MKQWLMLLAAMAALTSLGACATSGNPSVDSGGTPSFDGLVPLTGTKMQQVWVRKDLNLNEYTKFMPVGAGLQFRPVKGGSSMRSSSRSAFPLSPEQQEQVAALVTEEFSKALQGVTSMQRVDKPGPDVLLVRGAIIDIVSRVPPEGPGRADVFLDSVGQATFVIELIDSETSTVLLRAADTRAADTPGQPVRSNRVRNTAEVRRLAAYWAKLLVDGLNSITTMPSLHGDQ
jgi:hypothetical protein